MVVGVSGIRSNHVVSLPASEFDAFSGCAIRRFRTMAGHSAMGRAPSFAFVSEKKVPMVGKEVF